MMRLWRGGMMWQITLILLMLFAGFPACAGDVIRSKASKPGTYVMTFTGDIEPGDAFKIKQHLTLISSIERNQIARKRIQFFASKGGDLEEGMRIGRLLREFQIGADTVPNSFCLSACALAFLGGTSENKPIARRVKYSTSELGFHSFGVDSSGLTKEDINKALQRAQIAMLDIVRYFIEMDGDPRLLERMIETPASAFYFVSNDDALSYCIFVYDEIAAAAGGAATQPTNPYTLRAFKSPSKLDKWSESRCTYGK